MQEFYDGFGRRVKELPALQRLWGDRMRRDVGATVINMGDDPSDYLALAVEDRLHVFGPKS